MTLSRVHVCIVGVGAAILLATQSIDTRAHAQAAASGGVARRIVTVDWFCGAAMELIQTIGPRREPGDSRVEIFRAPHPASRPARLSLVL